MREDVERVKRRLLKDIRAGIYAYLILNLIEREGVGHGYWLLNEIERVSNGLLKPSESTIYEVLKQLEKSKLLKSFWGVAKGRGPPRKYYKLTELGKLTLAELRKEVINLINVIMSVSGGGREG